MGFEKISTIVEIEVKYITRSALAILSGREGAFAPLDQVVIKLGGQPIIPGSSLKGAIRSAVESLLAGRGVKVCVPDTAVPKDFSRDREGYARQIGRLPACDGRGNKKPCPVCQVFGTADLAGRASFMDAKPEGAPKLIERSHVALTRDNRAAAGGKLLQLQAVDAGSQFAGTVRIMNPEDWHVGAVLAGLRTIQLTGLGAKKTAGYGDIEVKEEHLNRLVWTGTDWKSEGALDEQVCLKAFAELKG